MSEPFDTVVERDAAAGCRQHSQLGARRPGGSIGAASGKRPAALVGTIIFCVFLFLAVFGPWIAPYEYGKQNVKVRLDSPTASHPFGTDRYGRDILSRVIVGTRNIFLLGGTGRSWQSSSRTAIGLASGYVGGMTDEVVMQRLDAAQAFPSLLLALVLLSTVGPSSANLVFVVAAVYTPKVARVARSTVLDLKSREFVEAARGNAAAASVPTCSSARYCPTRCLRCLLKAP